MLTFAIAAYIIMCFISNWDFLWPITMLGGGLGDQIISIVWFIFLIIGFCNM